MNPSSILSLFTLAEQNAAVDKDMCRCCYLLHDYIEDCCGDESDICILLDICDKFQTSTEKQNLINTFKTILEKYI